MHLKRSGSHYLVKHFPVLASLILALTVLTGCMSSEKTIPSLYEITFDATNDINSTMSEPPAPLKVRIFYLNSDNTFMSEDFYSLQNEALSVLGKNVIDSEQFFLIPGQKGKKITGQNALGAKYFGVIAEYRQLEGKVWRLILPMPEPTTTNFYKFWQFSPDKMEARIDVAASGLYVTTEE